MRYVTLHASLNLRSFDGRLEAEGVIDNGNVVVNGFRDTGHGDIQPALDASLADLERATMGSICHMEEALTLLGHRHKPRTPKGTHLHRQRTVD